MCSLLCMVDGWLKKKKSFLAADYADYADKREKRKRKSFRQDNRIDRIEEEEKCKMRNVSVTGVCPVSRHEEEMARPPHIIEV